MDKTDKSYVYVVCEPVHRVNGYAMTTVDLTPARQYGDLVVLLPHSQSLLSPVPTVRTLREKLRNFSDNDYLLPIGDPVLMSTVAMVASEFNHGKVKFLKWDKVLKNYIVIQVDISGKAI